MKHTEIEVTTESSIIDVQIFFSEMISSYRKLEERAIAIIENIDSTSAEELAEICQNICNERRIMSSKEENIFDILNFFGQDLAETPLLNDYRSALSRVNTAFDIVHYKLQVLRQDLTSIADKRTRALQTYQTESL